MCIEERHPSEDKNAAARRRERHRGLSMEKAGHEGEVEPHGR